MLSFIGVFGSMLSKYSGVRHLWSELKCIHGLVLCPDRTSIVPRGGVCDTPGPGRCCCASDEPSSCRIPKDSELKRSLLKWRTFVCPWGYRHYRKYSFANDPCLRGGKERA